MQLSPQAGILQTIPRAGRYLFFILATDADPLGALTRLKALVDGERLVLGIGLSTLKALAVDVPPMRDFPVHSTRGIDIPSTPSALWCWLRGEDRGDLLHLGRQVRAALAPDFLVSQTIDAFQYGKSLDLTGYEDGTENPQGDDAINAAVCQEGRDHLRGSSFVAVQQWIHNLDHFQSLTAEDRDFVIGRHAESNEEIEEAPESAHVKRTAQEDFEPAAFVVRRSMPWCEAQTEGLVFVAFGHNFDAFEALLKRMLGYDDGVVDALFCFTRPITGSYFWCPPMRGGVIDLEWLEGL